MILNGLDIHNGLHEHSIFFFIFFLIFKVLVRRSFLT